MKISARLFAAASLVCALAACDDDDARIPLGTTSSVTGSLVDSNSETAQPVDVDTTAVSDNDTNETALPVDVL